MAQDLGVTVSLHPLWGCLLHQQLSHKDFLVLVESLEVHQRFKGESRGGEGVQYCQDYLIFVLFELKIMERIFLKALYGQGQNLAKLKADIHDTNFF